MLHLDANRAEIDVYNVGWKAYLQQRETDEKRRKRERANAEKKAKTLTAQADKMRAKATKAQAAQNMPKRAERLLAGLEGERQADKVARIAFPAPAPCGKTPLTAAELSKSYGSLEVFTDVDLAIDRGSRVVILGLNGAGKTTLLRILGGRRRARHRRGRARATGSSSATTPRSTRPSTPTGRCCENMHARRPAAHRHRGARRCSARSCSPATTRTSRPGCSPAARRPGWRWRSWSSRRANVLLLDEPTNNLDPASREEVLAAIREYAGAIILVTHDEGAVRALEPDRVLILPDGVEDLWTADYADLVSLA